MREYDFDAKLKAGRVSEKWAAKMLSESAEVTRTNGGPFDLIVHDWVSVTVDVKRDEEAERTGNLAIEVMSDERRGALGWAAKAKADFTLHHLPELDCTVYIVRSSTLVEALPKITEACKLRRTSSTRHGDAWTTAFYAPFIPNLIQWGVIEKTWKPYYGEPLTLPSR